MSKYALGMSGGVDSTMAALILKQQGHEVIGVTMAIWDESIPLTESIKSGCFGPGEKEDLQAARQACAKLGIPHYVIDLKEEFKSNVLSYFCSTYAAGKTPNPCLVCNQRMKFGFLPQRLRDLGIDFDYFSTGHYARIYYNDQSGRFQLFKAKDPTKDQSYFLSFLSQEQLSRTAFPMGDYLKAEIRELAIASGFSELSIKQESQDFFESDDYSILFPENSSPQGDMIDVDGKVLARHQGLIHYTIGQRKNLGIAGQKEPYYVLALDPQTNTVKVGPKRYLYSRELLCENVNWVSTACPVSGFRATAKIRLQHEPASCRVEIISASSVKILFDSEQLSITPGQGVVIYDGDIVLAGAIIR